MTVSHSDALVLFGVTGDLAHKKIFPALYAMAKKDALKVPVIGVAMPKWDMARLRDQVTDSVRRSGEIDDQRALKHLLSSSATSAGTTTTRAPTRRSKQALGSAGAPRTTSRSRRRSSRR